MSTEIEFKWNANVPRAFFKMQRAVIASGAKIFPAQHWQIVDVYLDTSTHDFEKQQIAFRVRRINQQWEATFKTRTEIVKGKAVRREETLPLNGVKNLPQALQFLHDKKRWKGLFLENLQPLFVLKNRRKTHALMLRNMCAELAFDTCEIDVCGRRVFFKEIELYGS